MLGRGGITGTSPWPKRPAEAEMKENKQGSKYGIQDEGNERNRKKETKKVNTKKKKEKKKRTEKKERAFARNVRARFLYRFV